MTVNDTKGTGGIDSTYPFKIMSDATFILNGGNITSNKGSVVDIYTSVSNVHVGIHGGAMTQMQIIQWASVENKM